jgi:hypothetical protein
MVTEVLCERYGWLMGDRVGLFGDPKAYFIYQCHILSLWLSCFGVLDLMFELDCMRNCHVWVLFRGQPSADREALALSISKTSCNGV